MNKRKGQMGIVTFLFLLMIAMSFVGQMLTGQGSMFTTVYRCLSGAQGTACDSFKVSIAGNDLGALTLYGVVFLVFTGIGVLAGIGTISSVFPNPYAYFMPIAGALIVAGAVLPTQLFLPTYNIPEPIRLFFIACFGFVNMMAMMSWLKGGGQA